MDGSFPQRHRLAAFYVIALAIVCAVMLVSLVFGATAVLPELTAFLQAEGSYPNVISIGRFAIGQPWGWLIIVFAAAPTLAAVAVTLGADGWKGLRCLVQRLKPWRTPAHRASGRRAWLILLAAGALGTAAYLIVALVVAPEEGRTAVLELIGPEPLAIVATLLIGPFIDEGGLLEELGWRGHALPSILQRSVGPLAAGLVVGVMWWAWHLPREIATILAGVRIEVFLYNQGFFLLLCVAMSLVIMPFWLSTGGSALVGIFVHGMTNVWSKALGAPMWELTGTDVRTWIVVAAAGLVMGMAAVRGRAGVGSSAGADSSARAGSGRSAADGAEPEGKASPVDPD